MNDVSLLPGQEVDPCLYEDMSAYGMEPPKGLLECNGMVDGFISDCPEGIDSYGRGLHAAFGTDGSGRCFYLGLTPVEDRGNGDRPGHQLCDRLEDMRMDWILSGGSDPLDTRDSMNFLAEYCSRFGLVSDDYGELLGMIPDESTEISITGGTSPDQWDQDTSMLMHDRASILRYRRV